MMWFGISAVLISFVLAILLFYVRVQPPTVIRIAANGDATVVSGATTTPRTPLEFMSALAATAAPGEQPADIEGRAVVRRFLENYLTYTPTSMEKNWADALNMMTHNLRTLTLAQLRDQDIVSKVHDDEITSAFKLRSLEPVKGQPWTYVAFGVKEVHRIHNKAESTDRLVAQYNVRLLQTERSERVPSGLLVAEACGNFLGRGRRVFVRGRNRTRAYEGQGGKKRWVTEVIAETVQFLDSPSTDDNGSRPAPGHPQPVEADDKAF